MGSRLDTPFNSALPLSQWEHTSTAFGAGQGCNFKLRVAGLIDTDEVSLQREAFRLSRIIDHHCLEKDIPFFKTNPPTLENIAQYLFACATGDNEVITYVEIDGNSGLRARVGRAGAQIILNFTARNLRRVFNVEVNVGGFISPVNGMIMNRLDLDAILRQHLKIPETVSPLQQDKSLVASFSVLKATLLPRKLKSITLRDALENRLVLQLQDNDTSLAEAQHLHL
jgi:hypothetical protein